MISTEWFRNQTGRIKFIPVLRGADREACTPNFVQSFVSVNMQEGANTEVEFRKLLSDIYDVPYTKKPQRGARPDFAAWHKEQEQAPGSPDSIAEDNPPPATNPAAEIRRSREHYQKEKQVRKLQSEVRKHVAEGNTRKATDALNAFAEETGDGDLQNEITMISSRQAGLERQKRMGIISSEQEQVESNRIVQAVLQTLQSIIRNVF